MDALYLPPTSLFRINSIRASFPVSQTTENEKKIKQSKGVFIAAEVCPEAMKWSGFL